MSMVMKMSFPPPRPIARGSRCNRLEVMRNPPAGTVYHATEQGRRAVCVIVDGEAIDQAAATSMPFHGVFEAEVTPMLAIVLAGGEAGIVRLA